MNGVVLNAIDISNKESWLSGSIQNLTARNLGKEYTKYYRLKSIIDTYSKEQSKDLNDRLKRIVKNRQRKISNLYLLMKIKEQTNYSISEDTFIHAMMGEELDITELRQCYKRY